MRVAVESLAQARLELGDAAFENEGRKEVGLLGVVEVAEEIREDPPSPRLRRGKPGAARNSGRGNSWHGRLYESGAG